MKIDSRGIKKILIVSYDWPPRNAVSTHRPYSWAKFWSENGLEVTVITAVKKFYDSPLDLLSPNIDGVRVIEIDYNKLIPDTQKPHTKLTNSIKFLKNILSQIFGFSYDIRSRWSSAVYPFLGDLPFEFDVVVSTYGPDSSHKIAGKIKSINPKIFWVADYRDLWSFNARAGRSWLHNFILSKFERRLVAVADQVVTVSDELSIELSAIVSRPVSVIFNGYDVDYIPPNTASFNIKKPLSIAYTGRIYPGKQNPLPLIKAIEKLIHDNIICANDVIVDFYGVNNDLIKSCIGLIRYPEVVRYHGHKKREYILNIQKSADVLLLLESPELNSKGVLTGKLFEYLGAGKPIFSLGSTNDSAIGRVLNETCAGMCFQDDVDSISRDLLLLLNGKLPVWFNPKSDSINKYSRKYQANLMLNRIASDYSKRIL